MKKMAYTLIFIVILAILVFAGCKSFSLGGKDSDDEENTSSSAVADEADAEEAPAGSEQPTDEDGSGQPSEPGSETSTGDDKQAHPFDPGESTEPGTSEPAGDTTAPDAPAEGTTANTPGGNEGTTKDNGAATTEGTTAKTEPSTSKPPANVSCKEYDALRSGVFYMEGTMQADGESNPIILARDDTTAYMHASMDGASMGILLKNKKTYLLNSKNKTYTELSSVVGSLLQNAGLPSEEELASYFDNMGFSEMRELSDADSVSKGTLGGAACTVYTFNKSDGSKTRVYVKGDYLLAFEIVTPDGKVDSATYISKMSTKLPQLPPADYSKENLLTFISNVESELN